MKLIFRLQVAGFNIDRAIDVFARASFMITVGGGNCALSGRQRRPPVTLANEYRYYMKETSALEAFVNHLAMFRENENDIVLYLPARWLQSQPCNY